MQRNLTNLLPMQAASASRLSGKVIGRLHRWNQKGYSKNVVMAAAKEGSSASK